MTATNLKVLSVFQMMTGYRYLFSFPRSNRMYIFISMKQDTKDLVPHIPSIWMASEIRITTDPNI